MNNFCMSGTVFMGVNGAVRLATEKRRRAAALQDAGAFSTTRGCREASWNAPVLWRFGPGLDLKMVLEKQTGSRTRHSVRAGLAWLETWPGVRARNDSFCKLWR